jgi:NAD(P)-dependent dehydrogenase (short-subunit alcohol dehydrogenase family)
MVDADNAVWFKRIAMPNLTDQVVLVTGCSSGIGRALVRRLAECGHRVFATARRPEALDDLKGARVDCLRLDVTDEVSAKSAVDEAMARAGRIDMLVNNAGYILAGPLAELPLAAFKEQFDTNVTGALSVIQAVFPHMAKARSGRIVNIGSIVGVLPTPFTGAYCASKSALHMLSEVLRMEVAPFGLDVVLVEPGSVRSNIAERASQGLERYVDGQSLYGSVQHQIAQRARTSQERPMETDVFASKVVAAITKARPPRVVRVGRGARALAILAQAPGSVRDALLMRRFGVHELDARLKR